MSSTAPTAQTWQLNGGSDGGRSSSLVPVEVVINSTASTIVSQEGITVPPGDYMVWFSPMSSEGDPGAACTPVTFRAAPRPVWRASASRPGWVNPATGIPYQLTFGWVGSTGSVTDVHDVSDSITDSTNGTPPTLSTTLTNNAAGTPAYGSTMDYTVGVSNAAGATADPGPITVSDTLPAGTTPQAGAGGTGCSCTRSGRTSLAPTAVRWVPAPRCRRSPSRSR